MDLASNDPDADIIPRLAAGDEHALGELMDRHMTRLHALAGRLLGDPVMAEDVTQTVFLKTWQMAPDWTPGRAKLITWMSRVCTHACFDILKKTKPVYFDTPPEDVDTSDDVVTGIMTQQRAQSVTDALAALPDNQRAAIVLCYYQYMPQTDAASILGISLKAYESLLSRARQRLRETLDPNLLNLGQRNKEIEMTQDLKQLIEIYGTDAARWPEHLRGSVNAAMRAYPDSAQVAGGLDNALDSHTIAPPSDLLRARIMKAVKAESIATPAQRWHERRNVRFGAMAAALLVCAVIGFQTLTPPPIEDTTNWVEAANDLGIEDLYAWVEGET